MNLSTLIRRNIARNPRSFLLASAGVVLGIATLVFFMALGTGVQTHVLDRIFVVDQLLVVPRTVQVGAFGTRGLGGGSGTGLDASTVEELAALPGVKAVHPRLHLRFPAYASGGEEILGDAFWTELIGDGIAPALLDDELAPRDPLLAFRDWGEPMPCASREACPPSSVCEEGLCVGVACLPDDEIATAADRATLDRLADEVARRTGVRRRNLVLRDGGEASDPSTRWRLVVNGRDVVRSWDELADLGARGWARTDLEDAGCPAFPAWCQPETRRCEMPVPVLVSTTLLELYNSNVQSVLGGLVEGRSLPRLSEEALIGFGFRGYLGRGFVGASQAVASREAAERSVRLRVVGFSERAIPLGVTVPLGYAARWNAVYRPELEGDDFDALLVVVESSRALHPVAHAIQEDLGLSIDGRYEQARRASLMITLLTGVIALFSLLVVALAALNIMNMYLMMVAERRHEIGVLRAVGARRGTVYAMILGEALCIGVVAVTVSLGVAEAGMAIADAGFARGTPEFPFKPETLFTRPVWLYPLAYGLGVLFCVVGAWWPARRAARMDPSEALRGG